MKRLLLAILCCLFVHSLHAQSNKPIFIVEGHRMSSYMLSFLPSEKIQSITVLKEEQAKAKYGEAGSINGMIEVKFKNKMPFLSYAQLLDSFAIPCADKHLPAFINKYFLRDKKNFYALKNQIKNVLVETVDNRKIIRIFTVRKYDPYNTATGNYMINGEIANGNSIDFINPDAVKSVAKLNYDEAGEIYGHSTPNTVTIYLNNNDSVKPLSYFYDKFLIPAEAQDWPLFYASTDNEIAPSNFVAMPSMVKNMQVNKLEMKVEIEATPIQSGVKTLAQKIKENSQLRGLRGPIMICVISRQSFFQQYVKR